MPYIKVKYHPEVQEMWVKLSDEQTLMAQWDLDDQLDVAHSRNRAQWVYREVVTDLPDGEFATWDISEQ